MNIVYRFTLDHTAYTLVIGYDKANDYYLQGQSTEINCILYHVNKWPIHDMIELVQLTLADIRIYILYHVILCTVGQLL
jgi:hypothetical protein